MLIPLTLIEEVIDSGLSSDQQDCVLRLRDADGQEVNLGIPVGQLPTMIEHFARMLSECARDGHDINAKLIGTTAVFGVQWWTRQRDADGTSVLVLALGSGAKLAFTFSPEAIAALRSTLSADDALRGSGR